MKFLEDKMRHLAPEDFTSNGSMRESKKENNRQSRYIRKDDQLMNPLLRNLLKDELNEGM